MQPLLDVILFTRSLAAVMGYRGQMGLYSYYLLAALVLRRLSPPLALMTAQEAGLSGNFRQAHQVGRVCQTAGSQASRRAIVMRKRSRSLCSSGDQAC